VLVLCGREIGIVEHVRQRHLHRTGIGHVAIDARKRDLIASTELLAVEALSAFQYVASRRIAERRILGRTERRPGRHLLR
jgi:hypothetical protein